MGEAKRKAKQRKLYQNLTIDEPLPRDEVIEAEVAAMTPEQVVAAVEYAWFANPGGHFRLRILRKFENAGVVRFIKAPDGREQMQYADVNDLRIPPKLRQGLKQIIDLVKAVNGVLDEPYDPDRTRADYLCH